MKDEGLALVLLAIAAAVAGGGGFAFRDYVTDGERWQATTTRVAEQPVAAAATAPMPSTSGPTSATEQTHQNESEGTAVNADPEPAVEEQQAAADKAPPGSATSAARRGRPGADATHCAGSPVHA